MALHCYYQTFSALIITFSMINVNLIQSASIPDACLNYCSGGGYCYQSDTGPKCICSPKWTGERCNTRPNDMQVNGTQQRGHPCKEVPADFCKNDGFCYIKDDSGVKKLACSCEDSYTGDFCETPLISICEGYCLNGGECEPLLSNTEAACDCPEGWNGIRCQIAVTTTTTTVIAITTTSLTCDLLGPNYCNSGTCVVVNGKQQCYCPPMKTGIRCETPINGPSSGAPPTGMPPTGISPTGMSPTGMPPTGMPPSGTPSGGVKCAQGPCRNGGRCFPNGNSYFCLCAAGYGGANCDAQG